MKKGKTKKQRPTPKNDLKKVIILIIALIIIIPVGIIALLPETLAFPLFVSYQMNKEKDNPTKELASIMPSFAEEHNLELISENNNPAGFSNHASYSYTYKGKQSLSNMKALIKSYLENHGYSLTEELKQKANLDENGNYKKGAIKFVDYWSLSGTNKIGEEVYITIDQETQSDNEANTKLYIRFTESLK